MDKHALTKPEVWATNLPNYLRSGLVRLRIGANIVSIPAMIYHISVWDIFHFFKIPGIFKRSTDVVIEHVCGVSEILCLTLYRQMAPRHEPVGSAAAQWTFASQTTES